LLRRAETEGRLQTIELALKSGGARAAIHAIVSKSSAGTPNSNSLEDQLVPLLIQEQVLLEDYGPDHPLVRSVRKRIELTRDFFGRQSEAKKNAEELAGKDNELGKDAPFAESVEQYVQSLKQELEESRIIEESLTGHFEREIEAASRLAKFEIEAEKRRKEIERTQQLFDGVIKRLQEIGLVKDYGGFTTKIINPAGPGRQVEPNPTRILSMAAFLGILGGFGLGYVVDIMDKSFRTPEEIRRRLGLPVVGHIPFIKPGPELEVEAGANGKSMDAVLCTYHRPQSRDAEAFRGVRTSLYFSTRGERHKVIQVTSPASGDGKTTLAANLAVSIAQSGKRTLLIDADFRRPRVHKIFGLDSKVGLASVFLGEAEMNDAIQQTAVPNLWALPCGPHPPNPAELLTSEQFAEALQVLREKFDFVVIDTPPLLAVSDPCAVAPRVDGVILTIRISKNGRPDAERAKEILVTLGAKVVGVVVNGVGDQGGYGYSYGGYGYGYGSYGYIASDGSNGSGEDGEGYYQSEGEEEEKTAEVATGDAQSAQTRTTIGSDDSEDDASKTDRSGAAGRQQKRGRSFLGWFRKG
jgi:capsular exopolysaccharide synthesis family protein